MSIKEIYQNLVDDEKIANNETSDEKSASFEKRLNLIDTITRNYGLASDFNEVVKLCKENSFVQGFKAGVQLMAESMNKEL